MASSGMLSHVAVVRTDVSEELSASIIRVTRISELRKMSEPQILQQISVYHNTNSMELSPS
jgi:hypothetical protein